MKPRPILQTLTLLVALCIIPMAVYGADEGEHRIDKWLTKSLERDYSTAGMRTALNQARQMWDQDMNASYQQLMKRLPEKKRTILKKSQRAWVAFRDADGEAIGAIISGREGTMYQLAGTDAGYQRVRDRALQLKAYEETLPPVSMKRGDPKTNEPIRHLKPGSATRKAVCNAFRIPMTREANGQKMVFVINRITAWKDMAFIHCFPQLPNGKPIDWLKTKHAERWRDGLFDDGAVGLLRRNANGQWTVVDYDLGMTDVSYENWPQKHQVPKILIFGK